MSVDIAAITEYLAPLDTVCLQQVQKEFSLTYIQVRSVFCELLKQNAVSYVSGFTYKIHKTRANACDRTQSCSEKLNAIDDGNEMLIKALRECIISKNVSASGLQRKLLIGYALAARLVESLDDLKLINYNERKVLVTAKEFNLRFGDKYKVDTN